MKIADLATCPDTITKLAHWHFTEWGHLYPDETQADFENELRQSLNPDIIPATFVMVENDAVIGSISLLAQDMPPNQQLTPWLANLYVHPRHRGKGVGKQLIAHLVAYCQQRGLATLYLFTPHDRQYYQGQGWQQVTRTRYHGEDVDIMRKSLLNAEHCH
uniref:GNAT family N-acetyltransferase n=1 Tax=Thaumasiovibrio occultus TaxID=1891184 RepID=UPI000B363ED3|nr:GNAT family N-acetyltransferase [Thaumasiovibrio occultus]